MDEKKEKAMKQETPAKGIILPPAIVGIFCLASTGLCIDFIEQAIRYIQEDASLLTIVCKTLAAVGWGLVTLYLGAKLWKHYQLTRKNRK